MAANSKFCLSILTLLMVCLLTACNQDIVYDHYEHTHLSGWSRSDMVVCNVPTIAEDGEYKVDVGLRTGTSFPFTSLTLIVKRTVYPTLFQKTDTLNCKIIDNQGRPVGKGLNYFQHLFPLSDMQLNSGDSLVISIRHDMRLDAMPGIADVGARVTRK